MIEYQGDNGHYELRWYNPLLGGEHKHRLVMRANDKMPALVSDWF